MFDVTPDEIALLNDTELRALIGRLCEAEVQKHRFSSSAVTWGGHQDAPDGGLDVLVRLPPEASIQGFIPRPTTGFQVKKSDMPRAKILAEMAPAAILRPAIRELAQVSGAYVIVSSAASTTEAKLIRRRQAMAEAAAQHAAGIVLDFYDCSRLATWLRDHPSTILWVKEKLGRTNHGWRSHGNWVGGPDTPYLLHPKARIRVPNKEQGMDAEDALRAVRNTLRCPSAVIRLVGLSGVGKTRFAQALFDERVGEQPLDPSMAFYVNMGEGPTPPPQAVIPDLIATKARAILVVDNCSQDLHRILAESCRTTASTASLLTIEYDIQDDLPEGTDVYKMDSPSVELAEMLLRQRFPEISQVDARTAATFADGNARIAIALARTVENSGSLAGLRDALLFERLFHQRQAPDPGLMRAAQACSLVYSLEAEDLTQNGELAALATLAEMSASEVYRHLAELQRRDLVQSRGHWRAILPHAIANRLAATALQNIPAAQIETHLAAVTRLLRSFSRRLGYLDTSPEAQAVAERWFAPNGRLGDLFTLNTDEKAMFENIAPANPEAALAAIERATQPTMADALRTRCQEFVKLLRSIAYDPALFDRCVSVLVRLAHKTEDPWNTSGKWNDAGETFKSLYFLMLSGTQTPIQQRLRHLHPLLESSERQQRDLGQAALRNALEAQHFVSHGEFEFGARSRDFDRPQTQQDCDDWFRTVLEFSDTIIRAGGPVADEVLAIIAQQFRGVWVRTRLQVELEQLCHRASLKGFWPEGWLAVKSTLHFDANLLSPTESLRRLRLLEQHLRPTDLVGQVRSLVLNNQTGIDFADGEEDHRGDGSRWTRIEEKARELGKLVANDEKAYSALAKELWNNHGRLWSFGRGLAEGSKDPRALWRQLAEDFSKSTVAGAGAMILRGFLHEIQSRQPKLAQAMLDDAVTDETLGWWFTELQVAAGIDTAGKDRLLRSLELGRAPVLSFSCLAYGRATEFLEPELLRELLLAVASKPDGLDIAMDILSSQIHIDQQAHRSPAPALIDAGRVLLQQMTFTHRQTDDYKLREIMSGCLSGEEAVPVAKKIASKLALAAKEHSTHLWNRGDLLGSLFGAQPLVMLNALFGGTSEDQTHSILALGHASDLRRNCFAAVPEAVLFDWCDEQPGVRYPLMARVVDLFSVPSSNETTNKEWSPRAVGLLRRAPNRPEVLRRFIERFLPSIWSGSLATILESNARALDNLQIPEKDPALIAALAEGKARLLQRVEDARRREHDDSRREYERFE